jgi:hypothetical protein
MHPSLLLSLSLAALLPTLSAQAPPALIGVNFGTGLLPSSDAFQFATNSLFATMIGQTATQRLNSLATVRGVLYSVASVGSSSAPTRQLVRIDPLSGLATFVATLGLDVRGLAEVPGSNELFAIVNAQPDNLVRIDCATGAVTTVGPTGFGTIQGLAHDGNQLWGWESTAGLLRIDGNTGAGTDINPAVGNQGQNLQFLCWDGNNLLGGNSSVLLVDRNNGTLQTNPGGPSNLSDIRGAEVRRAFPFGTGCSPVGNPPILSLGGEIRAGGTIQPRIAGLQSVTPGLLIVGLSNTSFNGLTLPIDLDPLLGTTDCDLLVSPDLLIAGAASFSGVLQIPFVLPNVPGAELHIQMAALTSTVPNLRFTRGATIKLLP